MKELQFTNGGDEWDFGSHVLYVNISKVHYHLNMYFMKTHVECVV